MPRVLLIIGSALVCWGLAASLRPLALASQPDKKSDQLKGKEDDKGKTKDDKAKSNDKSKETGKEPLKSKTPLDQMKLPRDAVIVVVEDLLKARELFPNAVLMSFDKWLADQARLKALEDQLKGERKSPGLCRLTGKVDGDFMVFRAEFEFATNVPDATIFLGLKGSYLADGGELDGKSPILDNTDDGLVVRVEKESNRHQLTLNFRVPAVVKKSAGGTVERMVKLDLPGSPATPLTLELPNSVKELVWNDNLEKTTTPGRWQIGLGTSRVVTLAWKEPAPILGNAPRPRAEGGQVKVDVDATTVTINADLFLEDSQLQTTKWHILLPPLAKMEVAKVPGGLTYDLVPPDKDKPYWTLDASGATAERWHVKVTHHVPRPSAGTRIPVGPFYVLGAFPQTGVITVTMPVESNLGQRLTTTRTSEVHQQTNTETEAVFTYAYSAPPVTEKNLKAVQLLKPPVELEWRVEKSQLESTVDYAVNIRPGEPGPEIEVTAQINVRALFGVVQAVDVKLPSPRPRGLGLIGAAAPGIGFPGAAPWGELWRTIAPPDGTSEVDAYLAFDEQQAPLKLNLLDQAGQARVFLRHPAKSATITLKSIVRGTVLGQRIRLEVPRPWNTLDRAGKVTMTTDKTLEFLFGPPGAEEPVPDRHRFVLPTARAPNFVDVAWRPYRREITIPSTMDIVIHDQSAQIIQSLRVPRDAITGTESSSGQIALRIPPGIDRIPKVVGGEVIHSDPARNTFWVRPTGKADPVDLSLEYDLAIRQGQVHVTAIRPLIPAQLDMKVLVWSTASVKLTVPDDPAQRNAWKERSIESVEGKDQFPALVLQGSGRELSLSLTMQGSGGILPLALVIDRALIQARMLDDGSQACRCLYFVRRIHASHLDIELPSPSALLHDGPTVSLGTIKLGPLEKLDSTGKVVRVKLHAGLIKLPAVLEIKYTVPAEAMSENSFWRTTLNAPIFRSEVAIGQMRWQLTLPNPKLAASLARPSWSEWNWNFQNGLPTPEPSVTSEDLESWLAKDLPRSYAPVTHWFAHVAGQPVTVYHLDRTWWLLGCSGIFLIVMLGTYLTPLPAWVFRVALGVLMVGVLALWITFPALMPVVLYGLQPGVILFLIFATAHWLMQERHRRQLVFLTGFTRAKPGSTMMRTGSAKRPREASTVDEPSAPAEAAPAQMNPPPSGPSGT